MFVALLFSHRPTRHSSRLQATRSRRSIPSGNARRTDILPGDVNRGNVPVAKRRRRIAKSPSALARRVLRALNATASVMPWVAPSTPLTHRAKTVDGIGMAPQASRRGPQRFLYLVRMTYFISLTSAGVRAASFFMVLSSWAAVTNFGMTSEPTFLTVLRKSGSAQTFFIALSRNATRSFGIPGGP